MPKSISIKVWQQFVPLIAAAVSSASESHPTVRVWKDTELIGIINGIAKAHRGALLTTFPPGNIVLEHMERMGWLHRLPLTENITGRSLFLMEQEAAAGEMVDALEVIQAVLPAGVISYFGAIAFHELSSQMPKFFHIGRLANGHPPESTAPAQPNDRNPLGTVLFDYDGSRCYETKRYRGLTPGVQMRVIGSRTWYRVTTLEQTLLDAILQPLRCGGEAVVFEAWEHAAERADFDRMAGYLEGIGRDSLTRRVGAMLEMKDANGSPAIQRLFSVVKGKITNDTESIPLLPGLSYGQVAEAWKVAVP